MSALQLLWFVLIAVLWSGFLFLEGYDFGVGMQFMTLARDEHEREALYKTIGPTWDGNEVWLVTAGGATFAAFPYWYASLFSGFYLLLLGLLLALIFRGASFEFREHMPSVRLILIWERLIAAASFFAPFFLGVILTAMVSGMPMDAKGNVSAGFFDYFNCFTLVGGIAVVLMSYVHGLNYTRIRIDGDMRERAVQQLKYCYPLLLAGEVVFAILLFFYTDYFQRNFWATLLILIVIVGTTTLGWSMTMREGHEIVPFITSGLTLVEVVVLLFVGLFPRVMVANNPAHSLTIESASSSPYTLQVMTVIALTILPIVLAYQIWSFWVFRKRIVAKKVVE